MVATLASIVPYLVLISHVLLVGAILAILTRNSWGKPAYEFVGKHAALLGFLIALLIIIGSLFYSEIIGYEACVLCWWQRGFLYPLVLVFGAGLLTHQEWVFNLAIILAILALLVGGYQEVSNLTGASLLSCTEAEGACSKIFVKEFGYITIPIMSVTASLYILLVAWAHKLHAR